MKLEKGLLKTTDAYIKKLAKGGIETVRDLLEFFPKGLEDTSQVLDQFAYVNIKEKNTLLVTLTNITTIRTRRNKRITKLIITDKSGSMCEVVFFTAPYYLKDFKIGDQILIHGKPKYEYGKLSFAQPNIEKYSANRQELRPVYSDVQGVTGKWVAGKIPLVKGAIENIPEVLPEDIRREKKFAPRNKNIERLHFPESHKDFETARNELAYEELFGLQYEAMHRKKILQDESEGNTQSIPLDVEFIKKQLADLPFELTDHQKIALFEILKDMEKDYCMQRLLQGDVGTGKTIIAFLTSLHAIAFGKMQVAYMAPTAILATQLFESAKEFFAKHDIRCELMLGSTSKKEKDVIKEGLANGNIGFVVGTHALIQEDVYFQNLGYAIIDEQHRFGVEQRRKLTEYASNGNEASDQTTLDVESSSSAIRFPHVLMMTATPIPRTLSMTLYGDQDISIIRQYPKGRKPIITKIINERDRNQMYLNIKNEIEQGHQVYWISPLVEESSKLDFISVKETTEKLRNIFPELTVDMLHGKVKAAEKDEIMDRFLNGETHILSATSVVEVGVNNQNATIICIEDAERFGLSQLHQFRGRVGRGEDQSYCYLLTDKSHNERLKAMESTNDGFELSEIDMQLRGPGEVYGVRQSGLPDLKLASMMDIERIHEIREDIQEYLLKSEKVKKE